MCACILVLSVTVLRALLSPFTKNVIVHIPATYDPVPAHLKV
jgi:hypothetical protein